jgi:hypothetical protein
VELAAQRPRPYFDVCSSLLVAFISHYPHRQYNIVLYSLARLQSTAQQSYIITPMSIMLIINEVCPCTYIYYIITINGTGC